MKVLITGANGLLGRALRENAPASADCLALRHAELDVTEPAAVAAAFDRFRPEAVLHCAAYTDVDGAEAEPDRAFDVNAKGSRSVAEAAARHEARLIQVSTDYVFDGTKREPYDENDTPAPLSVYGRSKRKGEIASLDAHPRGCLVVRTGWLYGAGKGFVDWARARLERGEELPLVTDQSGSPTWSRELAGALWTLLSLPSFPAEGLVHFVNAGTASWLDLGKALAAELGVSDARIRPIPAEALSRPAPRPRQSALAVARFERMTGERVEPWRKALADYLKG